MTCKNLSTYTGDIIRPKAHPVT